MEDRFSIDIKENTLGLNYLITLTDNQTGKKSQVKTDDLIIEDRS